MNPNKTGLLDSAAPISRAGPGGHGFKLRLPDSFMFREILRLVADFSDVVLESVVVLSYADLVALGPEDILRLLDEKKPPLQPSD
jgi:hypothetical protein